MKYKIRYTCLDGACEIGGITATFNDRIHKTNTLTIPRDYNGYRVIVIGFFNSPIHKNAKSILKRIEKVRIPNTVRQISSHCFRDFPNLKEIEFYGPNVYGKEESELQVIYTSAFKGLSGLTSFPFDKCPNLREISYSAFERCSLEEVDLSGTVIQTLYPCCFECNRIRTVKFPASLEEVCGSAFNNNCLEELDFTECNPALNLELKSFASNSLKKVSYPLFGCEVHPSAFEDNRFATIKKENELFV